ncbi:MAG TPA: ATP-binding cassette domain-containing protein [Acetobacteraceae bacterium]|nr:ATP-binding cassette domain-containing protein [Acetobacteraceae bacterium]
MSDHRETLRADNIVKRFGAVTALDGVSLTLRQGEILGILGDNGAGKSTLMKILTGYQPPSSGRLVIDGSEVALGSVDHARSLGIECVYQDLALANSLSVYHNMFLNREILYGGPLRLLNHRAMRRRAAESLAGMGVHIPSVDLPVERLSGGQRQAIAVARAVTSDARILLLDEPLAAMGAREAGLIIDLLLRLKQEGRHSIAMIMHNYAQTLDIADRIVLMQHGKITYEKDAAATSVAELMEIVRREYRATRERTTSLRGA